MGSLRSRILGRSLALPASSYRLPRDPAVDRTEPAGFESVGLAGNPNLPVVLGAQTSSRGELTRAGRPGFFRSHPSLLQARDLGVEQGGTLAPGTIRRNVEIRPNGIGVQGFFSWATNEPDLLPARLDPARPPQDEYIVSSLHLQLPDSLASVVSGSVKASPGLEPFRQAPTIQAGPSTGYPVLAPQIPSYGSRIPLRRPRGLVTTESGS